MKVALLGDVSMEFVAADMRRAGREVFVPSGFGVWREAVLDERGDLRDFAPDAAIESTILRRLAAVWSGVKNFLGQTTSLVPIITTASFGLPSSTTGSISRSSAEL